MSFARNLSNKYTKKLLKTTSKTKIDAAKTASKKLVHEIAKATGELIEKKIAGKIVKPKFVSEVISLFSLLKKSKNSF